MAGPQQAATRQRYLISGEAEERVKAAASMVIDKQISLLSNDKPAPLEHKGGWGWVIHVGAMGHDMERPMISPDLCCCQNGEIPTNSKHIPH